MGSRANPSIHPGRRRVLPPLAAIAAALAVSGCVATGLHVYNDTKIGISATNGDRHSVTYVRAYAQDGELVLYGRMEHAHADCPTESHVDLTVLDAQGQVAHAESIPVSRTGAKAHGWAGASFRTRISPVPTSDSVVLLAVHDSGCDAEER